MESAGKTKKYSKSQRPPKGSLPPLDLSERDRDTLGFLKWLGMADASQLAALLRVYGHKPEDHPNFKDGGGWRVRLGRNFRTLWQHSLINRSSVRDRKYKLRADEIYLYPSQKDVSGIHLLHRLERNEFLISLLMALSENPVASVKWIKVGDEISFSVSFYDPVRKQTVRKKVTPDIVLVLNKQGHDQLLFIEIDRSTESQERLRAEKILAYRQWFKEKGMTKKYGYTKMRVLFVATESNERKENIRATIKKFDPVRESRLFMVAHKNYSLEDPSPILDRVWQCAEDYATDTQKWHDLLG